MIGPAVALIDRLSYPHQTARGEIVGGSELAGERPRRGLESTEYVMPRHARHMVEMFPRIAHLRILRQWAGMLHPAPLELGPPESRRRPKGQVRPISQKTLYETVPNETAPNETAPRAKERRSNGSPDGHSFSFFPERNMKTH